MLLCEKRRGRASAAGAEERRGRASAAGAEERRGRASAARAEERRGRATAAEAEERRGMAGRVAVAEECRGRASCCEAQEGRGRGLSSWEEVAKKEREANEQHGGTVALVASPKERYDVESHQKTKVSRSIGAACSLSKGHQWTVFT